MIIDTIIGFVDTRLLSVKGGSGWTEYRLNGRLVRRDASAKLHGAKIKSKLRDVQHLTTAASFDDARAFGLRADFEHTGVEEDN